MILTNSGVLKLMLRIKSYIASQLNTKANSVHTHSISEIENLSSQLGGGGYSKSEVDTLLTGKADTSHTHTTSQITDFPSLATVVTIEEQGDGYIRYSNGIQICWGSVSVAIGTTSIFDTATATNYNRGYVFNYPKGFLSNPVASFSVSSGMSTPFLSVCCENPNARNLNTGSIMLFCKNSYTIQDETSIYIQAIGRWK